MMIETYGTLFGQSNVSDIEFHFLGTDKYAYPMFRTNEMREDALNLTRDLLDGKKVTIHVGSVTVGPGTTTNNKPEETTTDDTEDDTEETDWVTYVVIGAAAAIIIALLIPWKKK